MRVLIVDDEPDVLNLFATFFASLGHNVLTAENGCKALEAIDRDATVDAVLLDVMMPGIDGMNVLKDIQQREPHPAVVMMTARADERIFEALRLGAVDYVLKPLDLIALDTTLNAAVQHPK